MSVMCFPPATFLLRDYSLLLPRASTRVWTRETPIYPLTVLLQFFVLLLTTGRLWPECGRTLSARTAIWR